MSNTERFTPREGWLLVLTIFLASTSVTLLLLNATYTAQAQSEVDKNLRPTWLGESNYILERK